MDKTLEFIAIQVALSPHFQMIIERPWFPSLGANQRTPRMRNVDVNLLNLLIQ